MVISILCSAFKRVDFSVTTIVFSFALFFMFSHLLHQSFIGSLVVHSFYYCASGDFSFALWGIR